MSHNKTDSELTFHWSDGKTWYSSGYLEPKAGSFNITSDRRLKKNIKPYRTDILDGIEKVPVYTYNMKTESDDSPKRVGVMAQDVQAVFPELVDADESRMGLNYGHVAIMAFPAITELRQEKDVEISSLKQEVETLKSEMEGLKARLANVGTQEDRLSKLEELVAQEPRIVSTRFHAHRGKEMYLESFADEESLYARLGLQYTPPEVRQGQDEVQAIVTDILYKVDVNTLHKMEDDHEFGMNEIGRVSLRVSQPVFYDTYRRNRNTGSFILVDPFGNETLGAGMLR